MLIAEARPVTVSPANIGHSDCGLWQSIGDTFILGVFLNAPTHPGGYGVSECALPHTHSILARHQWLNDDPYTEPSGHEPNLGGRPRAHTQLVMPQPTGQAQRECSEAATGWPCLPLSGAVPPTNDYFLQGVIAGPNCAKGNTPSSVNGAGPGCLRGRAEYPAIAQTRVVVFGLSRSWPR